MRRDLIKILACCICKNPQLQLFEFKTEKEVIDGMLFCDKCNRFYPIKNSIPSILPDHLREIKRDLNFIQKYKDQIPTNIISLLEL